MPNNPPPDRSGAARKESLASFSTLKYTHMETQNISIRNNIRKSACHIPNMTKGNLHEEKCSVSVYINVNNLLTNHKCMIIYSK